MSSFPVFTVIVPLCWYSVPVIFRVPPSRSIPLPLQVRSPDTFSFDPPSFQALSPLIVMLLSAASSPMLCPLRSIVPDMLSSSVDSVRSMSSFSVKPLSSLPFSSISGFSNLTVLNPLLLLSNWMLCLLFPLNTTLWLPDALKL